MHLMYQKYAALLTDYCLEIKPGDRLLIQSTTLAETLVREVYRHAMRRGAMVLTDLEWREQHNIFYKEASSNQLQWLSPLNEYVFNDFEAFLYIRAPYNLRENQNRSHDKLKLRSEATEYIDQVYRKRTATGELKRCLCQFPTQAAAQEAGMSLEDFENFVFKACHLYDADPQASWLKVRGEQQKIVDFLDAVDKITYRNKNTDLTFSVKGRIWMNSDGQTNMPSGEVYTAPLEDSVNGHIYFDFPSVFRGHPVQGIRLTVENGQIIRWDADTGRELLDQIFKIDGARRFGEVAIGTNYQIQRPTRNILFDEKIGGTVHMAIGQAYLQTGGKNKSSVHWDMIADMKSGGEIWADGQKIYQDGQFLI
ncbi:MAG: aminopeptidase [Saprospiraceae bacterium]|nr:aminopeptidase [Saprospiraceae bacterium]